MATGAPVSRATSGTSTGSTLALIKVTVFLSRSSGAPHEPHGIQGADFQLLENDVPAASGTTAANGRIDLQLTPGLTHKLVTLGTTYEINIRTAALEPVTDFTGQQRRLRMLGYHLGNGGPDNNGVDGTVLHDRFDRAILEFQADENVKVDGRMGPVTRGRLSTAAGA